jgi:uncharacterized protein (TIGR02145 family)
MHIFTKSRLKNHLLLILIIPALISGCQKEQEPSVSTNPVSNITKTRVTAGGTIIDEGSSEVISRGVCWSRDMEPTIDDCKTTDGKGSGSFSSNMSVLLEDVEYYVRAYATNAYGTGYGAVVAFSSYGESPSVKSAPATNVSAASATLHAVVNAHNLATDVSFEYGTTAGYGITAAVAEGPVNGIANTEIHLDITELTMADVYHFRVKAVNALGTTYGNDLTFNTLLADAEGRTYNTVTIGKQVWMQENLKTTVYGNGDPILTTPVASQDITSEISPKYQWSCTNVENGRYYTYYTVMDSRGVCPTGWHVPSDNEWTALTDYLSNNGYGFEGNAKDIAKSLAATSGYEADKTPGNVGNDQASNNSSGFTGLSTGGRHSNGVLSFVGQHGIWWSSTESTPAFALFRCIGYIPAEVFRGIFSQSYGLPVRCLKD